ncbi:MAG: hypothetical protein HYY04_09545 [Chloroflexi bacterium]|nr:hypothetical protein [Chloroflexota bacterium]
MSRPVRVAVVGLGWPGMRHLEAYQKCVDAEVRILDAICRSAEAGAEVRL